MFIGSLTTIAAVLVLGVISGAIIQRRKKRRRHRNSDVQESDSKYYAEEYDEDGYSYYNNAELEYFDVDENPTDDFEEFEEEPLLNTEDTEFISRQDSSKPSNESELTHESEEVNGDVKAQTSHTGHEINGIELCNEQYEVFLRLEKSADNYFITGEAGTGKSVLLQYFVKNSKKKKAIIAPTGIAALHVGGQTIHSFFGLPPEPLDVNNEKLVQRISKSQKTIFRQLEVLVIDEISMVRSDVMDLIDAKLKFARESTAPFGGCQVIAFGDLYQLPPVATAQVSRFIEDRYRTCFFFGARAVAEYPFKIIELKENHRQRDAHFIAVLNQVRIGNNAPDLLEIINSGAKENSVKDKYTVTVTSTRAAADRINVKALKSLPGDEHVYKGELAGRFFHQDLPTAIELHLKVGARVMILANDHAAGRWANGTIGEVTELSDDVIKVRVNDVSYSINKYTWVKYVYNYDAKKKELTQKMTGSFTQYPLAPAYAITIHKSQGQTFDSVNINLGAGAFAEGQTYVALSRCRNLTGLFLTKPLQPKDIKVNQEVIEYMKKQEPIVL